MRSQEVKLDFEPFMTRKLILVSAIVLVSTLGIADAQQPQSRPSTSRPAQPATPAQPAVSAQPTQTDTPQRTTATYNDWIVQCETQSRPPTHKVCDMSQVTQVQGKNLPFSRVAIFRPSGAQPIKLEVQLPVNASFAANVRIQAAADIGGGIAAPFARCLPIGCFADFELKDDALRKFRSATGPGKLIFADADGRDVSVPLSFNGFGQAYDALLKE